MTEIATLGGGCFWCTEAVFQEVEGVTRVTSGYSGGGVPNPSYEMVVTGLTGHAEVVQIEFDPERISFGEILGIFFSTHDPTTLNRQGADVGTQYRSVIFYHTPEQQRVAAEMIAELNREHVFGHPVVTELVPFEAFYEAEAYHKDFYRNNPTQGYCRTVIAPKVAKFRMAYASKWRGAPTGR